MNGLFLPVLSEPAKHLYKLLFRPSYRRLHFLTAKYGSTPRYHEKIVRLGKWSLIVPDIASFLSAYKEIFVEEIYAFNSDSESPIILDCGSNIGLSVFYFKGIYPSSKIYAFEPDPGIFRVLEKNILDNGISNVELINKAIWSSETTLQFSSEGADGGRIDTGNDTNLVSVKSAKLSRYLEQIDKVDFLKIDIEGAEVEVINECIDFLKNVSFIFIEFHSFSNRKQFFGKMISLLEEIGFRIHIHPLFISKRPFLGVSENIGMDMQLNLFFWKPSRSY